VIYLCKRDEIVFLLEVEIIFLDNNKWCLPFNNQIPAIKDAKKGWLLSASVCLFIFLPFVRM
jgi:hypothetical protein